jgi:hypothetical protein
MLHDRPRHLAQRWITYRRRLAVGDLFLGPYQTLIAVTSKMSASGPENVAAIVQGRLVGNAIVEAGLTVQLRAKPAQAEFTPAPAAA